MWFSITYRDSHLESLSEQIVIQSSRTMQTKKENMARKEEGAGKGKIILDYIGN